MNIVQSIIVASFLCFAASPATTQENPLYFGGWYIHMGEIARGERIPIRRGDLVVEPGWIVWHDPTSGVFFRARYKIIKDLGDRLVVEMATVYVHEPSLESIEIRTVELIPGDLLTGQSFDGRPQIQLIIHSCPSAASEAFARHVLAAGTPERVWKRILEASLEKNSLSRECRMTEEGEWYGRTSSGLSFGRFLRLEEQQRIDSDRAKYFPHWKSFIEEK